MKFDKSKILTVVTADQAKVGQKGWFGDTPRELETQFRTQKPYTLKKLKENGAFPFEAITGPTTLFYPEPTYAERQAEWVKENNVSIGTKVRITRAFSDGEDGISQHWNESMGATVGKVGVVECFSGFAISKGHTVGIRVDFGDYKWSYPYFTLEIIKEPAYRPYNNDELNDLVGKIVVFTRDGNKMLVIERHSPTKVRLGYGWIYTAEQLLEWFTLDGEPCGIKEEKE